MRIDLLAAANRALVANQRRLSAQQRSPAATQGNPYSTLPNSRWVNAGLQGFGYVEPAPAVAKTLTPTGTYSYAYDPKFIAWAKVRGYTPNIYGECWLPIAYANAQKYGLQKIALEPLATAANLLGSASYQGY